MNRYAYWWATDEEWLGVLAKDVLRIHQPQHGPPPADTAALSPSPSRVSSPSPSPIPSPAPFSPSRSMDLSHYLGRTNPERRSLNVERAFSDYGVATVCGESEGGEIAFRFKLRVVLIGPWALILTPCK